MWISDIMMMINSLTAWKTRKKSTNKSLDAYFSTQNLNHVFTCTVHSVEVQLELHFAEIVAAVVVLQPFDCLFLAALDSLAVAAVVVLFTENHTQKK